MLDRVRAYFRRRRHRPTYFQQKIADRTGEATIDILERHLGHVHALLDRNGREDRPCPCTRGQSDATLRSDELGSCIGVGS
jgi:hypothetical protein